MLQQHEKGIRETAVAERTPWMERHRTGRKAIEIYALGSFSLYRYGERIDDQRNSQGKPLNLLRVVISHKHAAARVERVIDALWPGAEADAAYHALETTLYRLRKLIGVRQSVLCRDGVIRINPDHCWLDVLEINGLLHRIEWDLSGKVPHSLMQERSRRLVELYRGPYLEDSPDQFWLLSVRETLKLQVSSALRDLGSHFETLHQPEHAIWCYRQAIAADPLAEELYQRLMLCLYHCGRKAEAMVTYDRCCRTLAAMLQISPSPKTEHIHQSLRG